MKLEAHAHWVSGYAIVHGICAFMRNILRCTAVRASRRSRRFGDTCYVRREVFNEDGYRTAFLCN